MQLILVMLLLFSNITLAKNFDTTPQNVGTIDTPKGYKTVSFDKKYTFSVPKKYGLKRLDTATEHLAVMTEANKLAFLMSEESRLYNPAEYGLKDYNRGQLLSIIYDNNYVGNKMVIETRKEIFKVSSNVQVFKRNEFVFYKVTRFDHVPGEVSLFISNDDNDNDSFLFLLFSPDKEELIMNIIQSFKAIP